LSNKKIEVMGIESFMNRKKTKTFTTEELIEYYKEHKSSRKASKYFGIHRHKIIEYLRNANIEIIVWDKVKIPHEIVLKDYKDGKNINRIKHEHGISAQAIRRILKLNNIEVRKKVLPSDHDDIVKKYKDGKTINQIRLEYSVTDKVIRRIIKLNNIVVPKGNIPIRVTNDEIWEAALKYKHRSDFIKGNLRCYQSAKKRKILDEVCSHMVPLGNHYNRLVYVYEFEDNHVYVGLTCNKNKRHWDHIGGGNSPVDRHIKKTGLTPKYIIISDYYIPYNEAQKLEGDTIKKYKEEGWYILNKAKAGGLGGANVIKWTDEDLRQEALKYNTRSEMMKKNKNAYSYIIQRNLRHFFSHMKWINNPNHTLEECIEEAKKYSNRKEFQKNRSDLYGYTYNHGYQNIVFSHMEDLTKSKWTIQEAVEVSKKYTNIGDFRRNDKTVYAFLKSNKDYKELTKHLKRFVRKKK
jgi:predicted GIY-YIG superfamily endonuclease